MARIWANYGIDSFSIDLNFYDRHFYDHFFLDNQYERYNGKTYQDVYAINGYDGHDDLIMAFGGQGIRFDGWGNVAGGTVTGLLESFYDGGDIWWAQDFSVSAVSLYKVGLTYGNADDRALLSSIMAGADTINLSAYDDRFEGWGGNDQMWGHGGNDRLFGGTGNDMLNGGLGNDRLVGEAGNDRLIGALDHDVLEGGGGADILDGGLGRDMMFAGLDSMRDVFVFRTGTETAVGAQRDQIHQFRPGQDDIDLSLIDANVARAGNQAFAFAGTTAAAHAIWYAKAAGGVIVRGDLNGNKIADFEIWVDDATRLGATDFIL